MTSTPVMTVGADTVLVLLCKRCKLLREHASRLIPVLRCSYSVDSDELIDMLKIVLAERTPQCLREASYHLIAPLNIDTYTLRRLFGVFELAGIKPERTYLHMSWETFLGVSTSEEHVVSLFKRVAKLYVYVNSFRQARTVVKLATSKPLSRFKSSILLVYYTMSADPHFISQLVKEYTWTGAPYIIVALIYSKSTDRISAMDSRVLDLTLKGNGLAVNAESSFISLPLRWYTDSQGHKWIGVVFLPRLKLRPLDGLPANALTDSLLAGTKPSSAALDVGVEAPSLEEILELLCKKALWRVKVEALVDGVPVISEEIFSVLKALKEEGTLKTACRRVCMSYPTVKSRIAEAEKTLHTKLIESCRGGMARGFTRLTPVGELLLRLYEELVCSLEEELQQSLREVCRKLRAK